MLLGDSGLGKTLSVYMWADQLMNRAWKYLEDKDNLHPKTPCYLPLFIRPTCKEWTQRELRDGLEKTLQYYGLPKKFDSQPILLIIDGYDECRSEDDKMNIVKLLGIPANSNIKLLITCRPGIVPENQLKMSSSKTESWIPQKR